MTSLKDHFLPLHASVLVPRLHLKLGESERLSEVQPVRCGEILLLLKLLLQPHELQFGEDGSAAAGLLEAGRAALSVRLAADAEGRLAGRGLQAAGELLRGEQGQVRGQRAWRSVPGQVRGGQGGRLPCDHRQERVGTQ